MFVKLKTMSINNFILIKRIKEQSSLMSILLGLLIILTPICGLNTDSNKNNQRDARKLFGGYRITPKFCRPSRTLPKADPRASGPTICMFNHECAQRNGEVVGACMDGFLFGACCQIPDLIDSTLIQTTKFSRPTSSSNLAAAYESYGSQQGSNEYQQSSEEGFYDNDSELENESIEEPIQMTNALLSDEHKMENFYVNQGSVLVSSPSLSNKIDTYQPFKVKNKGGEPYLPPPPSSTIQPPVTFSTELPTKITYQNEVTTLIQTTVIPQTVKDPTNIFGSNEFTHSDITHPGADTVLIEDDQQFTTAYGSSSVYVSTPTKQSVTQSPTVVVHKKPIFRPRPTPNTSSNMKETTSEDKYVLVQTITNSSPFSPNTGSGYSDIINNEQPSSNFNKQPILDNPQYQAQPNFNYQQDFLNGQNYESTVHYNTYSTKTPSKRPAVEDGMTTNNIESIESIILMLNESNHGPSYNVLNSTTHRITSSPNGYSEISTPQSVNVSGSNQLYENSNPYTTGQPQTSSISITYPTKVATTKRPYENKPSSQFHISSSSRPVIITSSGTRRPTVTAFKKQPSKQPSKQSSKLPQVSNDEVIITPSRKPGNRFPSRRPPSTSYVTGPTSPRPPSSTYLSGSSTFSTSPTYLSSSVSTTQDASLYSSQYGSSTQKIPIDKIDNNIGTYKPIYIQIAPGGSSTQRPHPTVIITPKPTVTNLGASTQKLPITTQIPKLPSTSYVFSPIVTRRPDVIPSSTSEYVSLPSISSNDFDDPGYYAQTTPQPMTNLFNQITTENFYPSINNQPIYPGFYGQTPSYSTFNVPTSYIDKIGDGEEETEEETYTSPNDFVNFPPVRNPNLNMSATSSAVTNDFDMSTPSFVEDDVLKNKMNILVEKIVASLQGNFQDLADLVDDDNHTISQSITKRPVTTISEPKPTTRGTTKRPTTKLRATTVKPGSKKPSTKRPTVTTKRPGVTTKKTTGSKKPTTIIKRPATTTKKPSKATKPTRRTQTTTTIEPIEEEIIEEQGNDEENEIDIESNEETRRFQCGVRPHVKSGRIVGGKGAVFGEWPWQVLVRESTWLGLFTKNKCGGVLITNKFVITAAHCQPGFLASLVAVFGEFDISGDLETKRSVTKNVKRVIVHRQYDAATFENDLALLELESEIHYDTHIVPVCMPPDLSDFTGRMATVTGWGRLKYGGGVPSVLQEVQVPIIENSVCQEMFHTAGHNKKILPSFLCAGYANGQKDSCEGDSGGPLVMLRPDGRWELAGTVSHGIKCAAPYLPGVYMRTTYYKPWLRSITGVK